MATRIYLFFSLLLIWFGIGNIPEVTPKSILVLFLVPALVLFFAIKLQLIPHKNKFNLRTIWYIFWLIKEVILSSIQVIKIAYRSNLAIIPTLDIVSSNQKSEIGTIIYANSITLTPGTVTLNMQDNKLLVHALDIGFMNDLQSGTMDENIAKIMK